MKTKNFIFLFFREEICVDTFRVEFSSSSKCPRYVLSSSNWRIRFNFGTHWVNSSFECRIELTVNETHPFSLFADDESIGLASNNVLDVSADFISNTWSNVHNVAKSSCAPRMTSLEKYIFLLIVL